MLSESTLFAFGLGAILQASGLLNFSIGVLTGIVVCNYYSHSQQISLNASETLSTSWKVPSFFLSYFSSKK